jgi:hypothetical protein
MKHSKMADALRSAAADMQLIAIMDGDWEMSDEMVLTYISNLLTDPSLPKPWVINGKWNPIERGQAGRGTLSNALLDSSEV